MPEVILYEYWRSSASYRVRIALNMLNIGYQTVAVDLLKGEQKLAPHLARNPQGLVPTLAIDGLMLAQSLAIVEYLEETRRPGIFLPEDPVDRRRVRALAHAVAVDIHPICNIGVVGEVMRRSQTPEAARRSWMQTFMAPGLEAVERLLDDPATGPFCHGDRPGLADICLVPQVYNAERWEVELAPYPRLMRIVGKCRAICAFERAAPRAPGGPAN